MASIGCLSPIELDMDSVALFLLFCKNHYTSIIRGTKFASAQVLACERATLLPCGHALPLVPARRQGCSRCASHSRAKHLQASTLARSMEQWGIRGAADPAGMGAALDLPSPLLSSPEFPLPPRSAIAPQAMEVDAARGRPYSLPSSAYEPSALARELDRAEPS